MGWRERRGERCGVANEARLRLATRWEGWGDCWRSSERGNDDEGEEFGRSRRMRGE